MINDTAFRTAGLTAAPVLGARDPAARAGHGHAAAAGPRRTDAPLLYTLAGND